MSPLDRFSGKSVFLTGGSRGIGAAMVKRMSAEGAKVTFTYAASQDRAEQLAQICSGEGGKVNTVKVDSKDIDSLVKAIDRAAIDMGSLDIFINNVGVYDYTLIENATLDMFDHTMGINVRPAFAGAQAAMRHMRSGGRIILIGSVNGDHINAPGGALYAMSKAALGGLTRGMARDLAPKGITVNMINPGCIDTETNPKDGPYAGTLKTMIALGDYGEAEDIAALAAFVASADAKNITGATLVSDGGMTA